MHSSVAKRWERLDKQIPPQTKLKKHVKKGNDEGRTIKKYDLNRSLMIYPLGRNSCDEKCWLFVYIKLAC